MAFEFKKCKIEGLYEIFPKIFGDNRGYFLETYSEKDFFDAGLKMKFVQDNQSKSVKYVLRGLHFQTKHPQGKLFYKGFYNEKNSGFCMRFNVFFSKFVFRNDRRNYFR